MTSQLHELLVVHRGCQRVNSPEGKWTWCFDSVGNRGNCSQIARNVRKETETNLCLAGGVALNCVANGKLFKENIFERLGAAERIDTGAHWGRFCCLASLS